MSLLPGRTGSRRIQSGEYVATPVPVPETGELPIGVTNDPTRLIPGAEDLSFGPQQALEDVPAIMETYDTFLGAMDPVSVDFQTEVRQPAAQVSRQNIAAMSGISGMALGLSMAASDDLQSEHNAAFFEGISRYLPDYKEVVSETPAAAIGRSEEIAMELLNGEVSSGTQAYLATSVAQDLGIEIDEVSARDLGLTTLDLQAAGADIMTGEVAPAAETAARGVMAITPETLSREKAYAANMANMVRLGLVDPDEALEASTRVALHNAEMRMDEMVSRYNMALGLWSANVNAAIGIEQQENAYDLADQFTLSDAMSIGALVMGSGIPMPDFGSDDDKPEPFVGDDVTSQNTRDTA